MKINIYILSIILLSALSLNAQLSTYEKPPSYSMKSELLKYDDKNIKVMPPIDLAKLLEEDKEEEAHGLPPRFGFKHKVSLNTENSGQWYKLDDGRRMWRLKISCPGAKSINLLYDKFWLPEGGKFFIYSADKRQCIGAFTTINNKGDRKEPRGFATELIIGDESVLEYYTPKEQTEEAIISIDYVVQGYKKLGLLSKYDDNDEEKLQDLGYGMSFPNHVNVNCSPEGDYWQMEKRAVAMIVVSGHRSCSGSLNGFGVTQGGSSGTPFLNTRHRISGYLRNGSGYYITNPSERYSEYVYFGFSWFNYPNADYRRRLNSWLDPIESERMTLDGMSHCIYKLVNFNINRNLTIDCDKVKFHNSIINNDAKVTIHTKKLVIENNFILNSGNRFEVNLDLPEQRK